MFWMFNLSNLSIWNPFMFRCFQFSIIWTMTWRVVNHMMTRQLCDQFFRYVIDLTWHIWRPFTHHSSTFIQTMEAVNAFLCHCTIVALGLSSRHAIELNQPWDGRNLRSIPLHVFRSPFQLLGPYHTPYIQDVESCDVVTCDICDTTIQKRAILRIWCFCSVDALLLFTMNRWYVVRGKSHQLLVTGVHVTARFVSLQPSTWHPSEWLGVCVFLDDLGVGDWGCFYFFISVISVNFGPVVM